MSELIEIPCRYTKGLNLVLWGAYNGLHISIEKGDETYGGVLLKEKEIELLYERLGEIIECGKEERE